MPPRATGPAEGESWWDLVFERPEERAALSKLGEITELRRHHIMVGGPSPMAGGHGHFCAGGDGPSRKSRFPNWPEEEIFELISRVARYPESRPTEKTDGSGWVCYGSRDGVRIKVVLYADGSVKTAHPTKDYGFDAEKGGA